MNKKDELKRDVKFFNWAMVLSSVAYIVMWVFVTIGIGNEVSRYVNEPNYESVVTGTLGSVLKFDGLIVGIFTVLYVLIMINSTIKLYEAKKQLED